MKRAKVYLSKKGEKKRIESKVEHVNGRLVREDRRRDAPQG